MASCLNEENEQAERGNTGLEMRNGREIRRPPRIEVGGGATPGRAQTHLSSRPRRGLAKRINRQVTGISSMTSR